MLHSLSKKYFICPVLAGRIHSSIVSSKSVALVHVHEGCEKALTTWAAQQIAPTLLKTSVKVDFEKRSPNRLLKGHSQLSSAG